MINDGRNASPVTGTTRGAEVEGSLTLYATTPFAVPTKTKGYAAAMQAPTLPPQPTAPSVTFTCAA